MTAPCPVFAGLLPVYKRALLAVILSREARAEHERARRLVGDRGEIVILLCVDPEPWCDSIRLVGGYSMSDVIAVEESVEAHGLPRTCPIAAHRESVRAALADVPDAIADGRIRDALAFRKTGVVQVLVAGFGGVFFIELPVEPST